MPKQKDLKRLVRTRMRKTGESYTAARARIIRKTKPTAVASPPDYARTAGMSDAAVRAKTGRTWKQWVAVLDAVDAWQLAHRDIARYLRDDHGLTSWWSQTVTVGYERIRGLRDVGQRRGGDYTANKSRTFPVPLRRLYRAFADVRNRRHWLDAADTLIVRTATPEKSMRVTWPDGTRVHLQFTPKGDAKSTVAVQHEGLARKSDVAAAKESWSRRLDALGELLRPLS